MSNEPHILGRELIIPWGNIIVKITKLIKNENNKIETLQLKELVEIPGVGVVEQDLGQPNNTLIGYTIDQYFKDPSFWMTSEETKLYTEGVKNEQNNK